MAWLRKVNFVTQPNVELYKSIANRLHTEAGARAGSRKSRTGRGGAANRGVARARYTTLGSAEGVAPNRTQPPRRQSMRSLLRQFSDDRRIEYGELTFFGDTRYSARGRAVRAVLDRAAERAVSRGAQDAGRRVRGARDESLVSRDDHRMRKMFFDDLGGRIEMRSPIITARSFWRRRWRWPNGAARWYRSRCGTWTKPTLAALDEFFQAGRDAREGAEISMARFKPPRSTPDQPPPARIAALIPCATPGDRRFRADLSAVL